MITSIKMYDAIRWRERTWFSNAEANGLYVMDEKEVKFVDFFPDENNDHKLILRWIFEFDDKLFFIPYQGKNIHVYDGKEIKSIQIKDKYDGYPLIGNCVYQFDHLLYILPPNMHGNLFVFDMRTCNISIDSRFGQELAKFREHNTIMIPDEVFIHISKGYRTNYIVFLYECRWLLEWNQKIGKLSVLEDFGSDRQVYWVMQDKAWMYYANGSCLCSSFEKQNKIQSIYLEGLDCNQSIMDCVKKDEDLYFIYDGARRIVKYISGQVDITDIDQKYSCAQVSGFNGMIGHRAMGEDVWIFSPAREEIIVINKSGDVEVIRPQISNEECNRIQKEYLIRLIEEQGDICEETNCTLSAFMEYIQGK